MDIIEFSDKQKSLRLKQEQVRKEITALMERYKSLEKEIDNNEYKALCNGTLDIKFGDFAKKVMETFKLPFNPKEITATVFLCQADIQLLKDYVEFHIDPYQIPVIFNIGTKFHFIGRIKLNVVDKHLTKIEENVPILLNTPEKIEINKNNISLELPECNYNVGHPFNPRIFIRKILKECFKDKVTQARASLYNPAETPVEKTIIPISTK